MLFKLAHKCLHLCRADLLSKPVYTALKVSVSQWSEVMIWATDAIKRWLIPEDSGENRVCTKHKDKWQDWFPMPKSTLWLKERITYQNSEKDVNREVEIKVIGGKLR